nr:hypothetical protein Iba_chr09fCG0060 [Ipomoea batatas]
MIPSWMLTKVIDSWIHGDCVQIHTYKQRNRLGIHIPRTPS